ncbi:unnamed protein product [Coregonus sp. 'balchen']|nr:unnamed protein product [Coregonus sp. 'balchen']
MFGGSSPQPAATPQTSGSMLGGLFGGSSPQPATTTPQTAPTITAENKISTATPDTTPADSTAKIKEPGDTHISSFKPDAKAVEVAQGQGIEKLPASALDCQSKEAEISTASGQPAKTEQPSKAEQPPTNDQSIRKQTNQAHQWKVPRRLPQLTSFQRLKSQPSKFLFGGFMSGTDDAGKSFGSMFSSTPTIPQALPIIPHAEAGGGVFSGFKTISAGLFQEEKPGVAKQEPSTASLFGAKLVVTTQPKANDKPTKEKIDQSSVGLPGDLAKPQICISTLEVDPPASLSQKEKESLVEEPPPPHPPSADPTSGVHLDNQSKKDLLSAKRPVEA